MSHSYMFRSSNSLNLYHVFELPKPWKDGSQRSPPLLTFLGLNFRIRLDLHPKEVVIKERGTTLLYPTDIFVECSPDPKNKGEEGAAWTCVLSNVSIRVRGWKETTKNHWSLFTLTQDNNTVRIPIEENGSIFDPLPRFLHIEIMFNANPPISQDGPRISGMSHVSADLLSMYESGEGTDVVLKSRDGYEFPCHKWVLASVSTVFKAMFQTNMKEKDEEVVTMEGMDKKSLNLFCRYVYSGNLGQAEDNLNEDLEVFKELVQAGDFYGIEHLCKLAAQGLVLRKNLLNAFELRTFLKQFNREIMADALTSMKQFILDNMKNMMDASII